MPPAAAPAAPAACGVQGDGGGAGRYGYLPGYPGLVLADQLGWGGGGLEPAALGGLRLLGGGEPRAARSGGGRGIGVPRRDPVSLQHRFDRVGRPYRGPGAAPVM